MAAPLSEADMKNVAAFYAGKQPKPGFAKNKDLVAHGEKIYRGGIAERSVPACSGCHGRAAPASRRSTLGSPASTPTTSKRSWQRFAAVRAQQSGDGARRSQAQRPRHQGGRRLRRRPALIGAAAGAAFRLEQQLSTP
jgi:cytochrome c553